VSTRQSRILAVVALPAMLAACQTTSGGVSTVTAIQQEAVAICGYLPLASVVAQILSKGLPGLQSVLGVANSVCTAVTPHAASSLRAQRLPMVGGVVLQRGRFPEMTSESDATAVRCSELS